MAVGQALVFLCLICGAYGEVFTALVEMEKTLQAESTVASLLEDYITAEQKRIDNLRELASDMARHSREALQNPVSFLGNPVDAFLLVKRFVIDWDNRVTSQVNTDNSADFLRSIETFKASFPDLDDYSGAVMALLRLQDTYQLDANHLAHGVIQGVSHNVLMSAQDCFEVGRVAYNEGDHYHTIQWMQEALNRQAEEGPSPTMDEASILDYLSYATYVQGNLYHARNHTLRWLAIQPNHDRAKNNLLYFDKLIREEEEAKKKGDEGEVPEQLELKNDRFAKQDDIYRSSHEFSTYEALCRNENVIPEENEHRLTCQYRFWHPFFYIKPLKEETMSTKPWLAVYHNIVSDGEIERMKELATPILNRATVHNAATGKLEYAKYRISKSGWLKDDDPTIARISQRCSALTNLSLSTVEELQVVNYGIGGHYEPHFDFSRRDERTAFEAYRGNRILTVIFYLSDVEAGGATVFINKGMKVWPEKGSAAVWYNLLPSGDGDYSTRHAACPVLTGSKWVANKWFHERGQEFNRLCGLTPESLDIFVN